jgi:palmitoyltransferase
LESRYLETSRTHKLVLRDLSREDMASTTVPPDMADLVDASDPSRRPLSIEELAFSSGMSCFEGWLKLDPAIGPRTMAYVTKFISRTLEKTHNLKDVR